MAYGTPPETPRTKPTTVNISVILLYIVAGLSIINAIIGAMNYGAYKTGYTKAYEGTSQAGNAASAAVTAVAGQIGVGIVLGIIFLVLAILVSRGSRVGRILTWVFGGLALCCVGSTFALASFGRSMYDAGRKQNPDMPPYDQLQNDINSSLPSWYGPVTTIIGIVSLLSIILAIILLALPASHPYFRKREQPLWEPPVPPGPAGPGTPPPPPGPVGPPDPTP